MLSLYFSCRTLLDREAVCQISRRLFTPFEEKGNMKVEDAMLLQSCSSTVP